MNAYVIFYLLFIFVLGAVMGSFVGAMTWRMKTHKDWVRGRSECEHCHHQLAVVDLIPILSYVTLGGKCRYCRKPIGRTAILLELGGGAVFLISALLFPSAMLSTWTNPLEVLNTTNSWLALAFGLWLVAVVIMLALFVYDARWRLLPNKLVFPLIIVSFVLSAVIWVGVNGVGFTTWLINLGLGMLPITGVYGLLYLASNGRWIGLGDVKLGVAIGCLVPWWAGIVVLFLSNLISTLVSVPGLIKHKIKGSTEIPFGPYLIIATFVVFLLSWVLKSIMLVL